MRTKKTIHFFSGPGSDFSLNSFFFRGCTSEKRSEERPES